MRSIPLPCLVCALLQIKAAPAQIRDLEGIVDGSPSIEVAAAARKTACAGLTTAWAAFNKSASAKTDAEKQALKAAWADAEKRALLATGATAGAAAGAKENVFSKCVRREGWDHGMREGGETHHFYLLPRVQAGVT